MHERSGEENAPALVTTPRTALLGSLAAKRKAGEARSVAIQYENHFSLPLVGI
jgi:hypothetical protein